MGISLDHRHGLMAADALDGWQIDSRLNQVRDGGMTEGVADDLLWVEARESRGSNPGSRPPVVDVPCQACGSALAS